MATRIILGLILVLAFGASNGNAQQELTLTTTPANSVGSRASIDLPGLTGNGLAIIVATPLGNTDILNPHPLGAWYYSGKWYLFNTDQNVMPIGSKFLIQFFLQPGPNQFLHVISEKNLGSEGSYIDNPALNDNPNGQFKILQNHAPEIRSNYNVNGFEARAAYSTAARRWYIANVHGEPLHRGTTYNIVINSGGASDPGPTPTPLVAPTPTATVTPGVMPTVAPTVAPAVTPTPVQLEPIPTNGTKRPLKNWVLRPDLEPSIPSNADILLFIHGMDSRAEEAEDITKALFALKANPPGPEGNPTPAPIASPTPDPQTVADLNRILQKYEGCILERYETQQDMTLRGLPFVLSALTSTNGLQDRDVVQCVAGNNCSRAFRQSSFTTLKAQANRGDPKDFETKLERAIPRDCFECGLHQERHTKHVHCTMQCGGNNGIALRPDGGPGPCFETCKAIVDFVKLVNDAISTIHIALSTIKSAPAPPFVLGGSTIATNYATVEFNQCPNPAEGCPEPCDHPDSFSQGVRSAVVPFDSTGGQIVPLYYEPQIPAAMLDTAPPTGTELNKPAARNIGSNEGRLRPELRRAAADADPFKSLRLAAFKFAEGDETFGRAYADLSVAGHRSFDIFRIVPTPQQSFCQSLISQRPPALSETSVLDGCEKALDRAYLVANFLRNGERAETPQEKTRKMTERMALGWIAVSGEDDSPHRPVNVPSSDYPQFDFDVAVAAPLAAGEKSVTLRTRYVIAQSPTLGTNGKKLVVISLDLPTSGYTENLDFDRVSPLSEIGNPVWNPIPDFQATGRTPLLDFIETFIVNFTATLDQKTSVRNNFKAVMGGSLGGNMTFRLGRRPDTWFPKFVVWSPASIWYSLGEGSDPLQHLGPRSAWEGADRARNSPGAGDRAAFFGSWDKPIVPIVIPMAQSDTWTSDYYPCKKSSVAAARFDRHETFDARFYAWHWRLGGEQLLFSHQTKDPATNQPRFMQNQKPMLLACGLEDTVAFNDICPATMNTAPLMTVTPGKALFLAKTGHSLDNERRNFWAREIFRFLGL